MTWEVEYTEVFEQWWNSLEETEQGKIDASVKLLEEYGPALDHPHTSAIASSRHGKMRELRIQVNGRPFRIFYAFDPRRVAILLIGGDKTGNNNWYGEFVSVADGLYDEHLRTIKENKDG